MHIPAHEDDPRLAPPLYLPLVFKNVFQLVALRLRVKAGTVQSTFLSISYRGPYRMPIELSVNCKEIDLSSQIRTAGKGHGHEMLDNTSIESVLWSKHSSYKQGG